MSQIQPPLVYWSEGLDRISIGMQSLKLDDLRSGIQGMISDAWKQLEKIRGEDRLADNLPKFFKDDLPEDRRGYSFMSHGPFTKDPNTLLSHLITHSKWKVASIDGAGGLCWNIPALHDILDHCANLNKLLAVLCFLLPSLPSRVTEFVDHKLTNADRPRNLHCIQEDMFLLKRYTKTTNLTGKDKCIPMFFPTALKELMLEYLAGSVRVVEELLAHEVHGPICIFWGMSPSFPWVIFHWVTQVRISAWFSFLGLGLVLGSCFSGEIIFARCSVLRLGLVLSSRFLGEIIFARCLVLG